MNHCPAKSTTASRTQKMGLATLKMGWDGGPMTLRHPYTQYTAHGGGKTSPNPNCSENTDAAMGVLL